jgi:hypothetical protein
VVPEADVGAERLVAARDLGQPLQILMLAFRGRQVERLREPDGGGNRFVDQGVQRADADRLEHAITLLRGRSDVTPLEPI